MSELLVVLALYVGWLWHRRAVQAGRRSWRRLARTARAQANEIIQLRAENERLQRQLEDSGYVPPAAAPTPKGMLS